jgi:hypothetical protein
MPMALMSGWIAADTLCQDLSSGAKPATETRQLQPH